METQANGKTDSKKSWFKRHKILTGVLIVVLLAIIGGAAGGSDKKNTQYSTGNTGNSSGANKATKVESTQAVAAKIGTPVRDGKFEFTVKGVQCGQATVGSQYLNKTAQGQFCTLNVTVKNIGDKAQSLFSTNQKLLNGSGQEYAADDAATIYASPDSGSAYNNINPGNSVEGAIVFDIPKDQTPVTAVLHDSAYSGGVKVTLK